MLDVEFTYLDYISEHISGLISGQNIFCQPGKSFRRSKKTLKDITFVPKLSIQNPIVPQLGKCLKFEAVCGVSTDQMISV